MIAVNAAIRWLPRVDAFFSLDPDDRIYQLMQDRRPGVQYFCAVPRDYGTRRAVIAPHRRKRLPHVFYLERATGNGPLGSRSGLSNVPGVIHTGNSAFGAMGLAKHMGAERVALFGVDGGRTRISGGRCKSLSHLPWLFSTVNEPGMQIVNASPASAVDCFPIMAPGEALEWLLS